MTTFPDILYRAAGQLANGAPDYPHHRITDDLLAFVLGSDRSAEQAALRLIEQGSLPRRVVQSWRALPTPAERLQALAAYLDEAGL